jgi:hypothetical protein
MKISEKASKFMSKKPTHVGTVLGYRFYEHPDYGDETTLKVITPLGKIKSTSFWDIPTTLEVIDWLDEVTQ